MQAGRMAIVVNARVYSYAQYHHSLFPLDGDCFPLWGVFFRGVQFLKQRVDST